MFLKVARAILIVCIPALFFTGCGPLEGSSSDENVEVQGQSEIPSDENLSRTWLSFTYEVYLLDRFIEEHGHEEYVLGSKDDPYVTGEDGSVVSVSNFDFLEESGVVDELQDGYSVNTDIDLGYAVRNDPEVRVSVKTVLDYTVAQGEVDWCESMGNSSRGYVDSFYGFHQTQDEAREHMVEYIDSCGAVD